MTSALFEILAEPNRHEHVVFDVIIEEMFNGRDGVECNYENAADLRRLGEIPQAPGDLPGFRS